MFQVFQVENFTKNPLCTLGSVGKPFHWGEFLKCQGEEDGGCSIFAAILDVVLLQLLDHAGGAPLWPTNQIRTRRHSRQLIAEQ